MQPYIPYILEALKENRSLTEFEARGSKLFESGDAEHGEVWDPYEENLWLVLDELEMLENFDAE